MAPDLTRILLVEDDEDDYVLTRDLVAGIQNGRFHLDWASDYTAGLEVMGRNEHDVYLVDYRLDARTGLDLLREARDRGCRGPIVLLTGLGEREVDLQAMKSGAADYLVKGRIDSSLLERSLRYAIERRRDREALRQAHDELEKRVEERTLALEQANQELQDADRRKDEFLAMLAHELRNPLAPIVLALHVMELRADDKEAVAGARDLVMRQVRHMTRLVDDLLDVSRITRGVILLRKEILDLGVVLARVVETVRPLADSRRQILDVSAPPKPIGLQGDPARLEQILLNLLNNAVKFTPEEGQIRIASRLEGSEAVVQVRDTGIGIEPDMLPRVFDLFTQADRSLDRPQGGMGIGLTLVRRLAELHGGTVHASSGGPGQGSTFEVRLPALPNESLAIRPESRRGRAPSIIPQRLSRILVVEDNLDTALGLAKLLTLWGYQTQVAHDGPTGLEAWQTNKADILLLDIGLPGMSGYQVARKVRERSGPSKPLILALTGYGQPKDLRRSREAGFDHHLVKPVDPEELQKLLADREQLCTELRR
jgi:signal transduction histidine kinase